MRGKLSPLALIGIAALALFTLFITWRAKLLEKRLHEASAPSALVSKKAADFSLPTLDGKTVSLADYRGKKRLVVGFWASWCGPCRLELPMLADFYKKYHKDSANFEILAVSIDGDRAAAESYASSAKLPFPVLLDPDNKAADAFSVEAIPSLRHRFHRNDHLREHGNGPRHGSAIGIATGDQPNPEGSSRST